MGVVEQVLLIVGIALAIGLQLFVLIRTRGAADTGSSDAATRIDSRFDSLDRAQERTEREIREAVSSTAQSLRTELSGHLAQFQQTIATQLTSVATQQNNQIDSFALALARFGEQQHQRFKELSEANERRLLEIRATLEQKITALQLDNGVHMDEMRKTVDEKLHATLEQRLGESFRLVSERLEAVQRGLGEMQTLAQGVGDLKRVLTNVKSRGAFGEVQLGALLENLLTQDQYGKNIATRPGSREVVEFAIRLPGQSIDAPVMLPIDAKFPVEDYERLLTAQETADIPGMEVAGKALETRIRNEAKTIAEKYLEPPYTTDFAILFLPTEGLYAEVLRRPGLFDDLQRKHKVTVAGPTTLTAMLNALQMGFRTLAIEKRSSEVWTLLGAVKTEFGKFGTVLDGTKRSLQAALNKMGEAEVRTRAIERKLRDVQELPSVQSNQLLETGIDTESVSPEEGD
jgi:DNA recombination protein RmuC